MKNVKLACTYLKHSQADVVVFIVALVLWQKKSRNLLQFNFMLAMRQGFLFMQSYILYT